jgi:hypothetical protein
MWGAGSVCEAGTLGAQAQAQDLRVTGVGTVWIDRRV